MNKRLVHIIWATLFVGCTNEFPNVPDEFHQEQGIPVSFFYSVSNDDEGILAPEVIESSGLPDGKEVGVFAIKGTLENGDFQTNQNRLFWDQESFQANFFNANYISTSFKDIYGELHYQLIPNGQAGSFPGGTNAALKFFVYYPYSNDVIYSSQNPSSPLVPIEIPVDQDNVKDVLYTNTIATAEKNVELQLKHVLARLDIYMEPKTEYGFGVARPKLQKIEVKTSYQLNGKLKLENGSIIYPKMAEDTTSKTYKNEFELPDTDSDDKKVASFLLLPSPFKEGSPFNDFISIDFTIDNKIYRLSGADLKQKNIKLVQGKTANLRITYEL